MDLRRIWKEGTDCAAYIEVQGQHRYWLGNLTYRANYRILRIILAQAAR